MPDDASIGVVIPMPILSFKETCYSIFQTIKFIDNWLQWFEVNYENIIIIYKENMSELFKTIPKSLPPKSLNYYKSKYQTTIEAVGGGCFLDKINSKLPPINIM